MSAPQRLEALRRLRMRGQAPSHAVMVTTSRDRTEVFEELRLATIEVYPTVLPRLDWRGVAGLYVVAVVHWREQPVRMQLFEAIRGAEPWKLHWIYAPTPPPGREPIEFRRKEGSSLIIENGQLWEPLFPDMWSNYGCV